MDGPPGVPAGMVVGTAPTPVGTITVSSDGTRFSTTYGNTTIGGFIPGAGDSSGGFPPGYGPPSPAPLPGGNGLPPGPGPGSGPPPDPGNTPPGCINVVSRWVTRICLTANGVAIFFKNVHHHRFSVVGCVYPGTGLADFNWILAQRSKGKAVWERFYYRPYYLIF